MTKFTAAQIEAFDAVMTCGTTVAAAEILNTSQSSISRSLNRLESATGLVLFERKHGRLAPTKDAHELLRSVKLYFYGLDQISHGAGQIRRLKNEQLNVSCAPALTGGFFARVISDLQVIKPEMLVSMRPLLSRDIVSALQSNEIDAGIAAYDVSAVSITSYEFTNCSEVLVLPKAHPLANKQTVCISSLNDTAFIKLVDRDPYTKRLFNSFDQYHVKPNIVAEAETSASACSMVCESVGLTIVNPITALDYVSDAVVIRRLDIDLPFRTTLLFPESSLNEDRVSLIAKVLNNRLETDLKAIEEMLRL